MTEADLTYIDLHGERLAYRDTGDNGGEVVVLLHGMAGSSDTWEALIPRLATRHRVIAPDLLGHGRSAKPRTDYSLGAFAAGLRDLLDELGISRATIVGHSLGGGIAMQFLYQHPEYCRRLVLLSSGGLGSDVGWILRLLAAPGAEVVLPVIAPKAVLTVGNRIRAWLSAAGWGSAQGEQAWQAYSSLADPPTRSAFLRTLRSVVDHRGQSVSALNRLGLRTDVPTLVIWGDRDAIIPVDHAYGLLSVRPSATLHVLPGLGHFPHVEDPAQVSAAILAFLTDSGHTPQRPAALPDQPRPPVENFAAFGAAHRPGIKDLVDDLESRRQVEAAIGVLMAIRGCSHAEAVSDFTAAVHDTGVAASHLGDALTALASGGHHTGSARHRAHAKHRWGHLLAARGLDEHGTPSIPDTTRTRYGPHNGSTYC